MRELYSLGSGGVWVRYRIVRSFFLEYSITQKFPETKEEVVFWQSCDGFVSAKSRSIFDPCSQAQQFSFNNETSLRCIVFWFDCIKEISSWFILSIHPAKTIPQLGMMIQNVRISEMKHFNNFIQWWYSEWSKSQTSYSQWNVLKERFPSLLHGNCISVKQVSRSLNSRFS